LSEAGDLEKILLAGLCSIDTTIGTTIVRLHMDYPAVVVIISTTPSSPVKPTSNGRYCITSNSDHVLTCSIRRQYCFIIAPWVGRRLVLGAKFAAHVARRVSRDRLVYLALRSQFSAVQYEYKSIYERAGTLSRRPKCNADVT